MNVAKPKVTDAPNEIYYYGTGRRKTAVAQVRVYPGTCKLLLNKMDTEIDARLSQVLEMIGKGKSLDISARVTGGGRESQIMAIRHGLARALVALSADLRTTLKKAGLLTRDPREKERQKYGLHGARRAPQFSKR